MEQNSAFFDKISTLRERLPDWMEWTLVGVYVISWIVGGLFLFPHFSKVFTVVAAVSASVMVPLAFQIVRLIVVFFDQLNPERPSLDLTKSYVASIVLGGWAVFEVVELVGSLDLHHAVKISLVGLMASGIIIELYILRELQHASNFHFFNNPENYQKLLQYHHAQATYKQNLKRLRKDVAKGTFSGNMPVLIPSTPPSPTRKTSEATFSNAVLRAIAAAYKINEAQTEEIQKAIVAQEPEAEIIKMIEAYSDINRGLEKKPAPTPPQNNEALKYFAGWSGVDNAQWASLRDAVDRGASEQELKDLHMRMIHENRTDGKYKPGGDLENNPGRPFEMDFSKNGNGVH